MRIKFRNPLFLFSVASFSFFISGLIIISEEVLLGVSFVVAVFFLIVLLVQLGLLRLTFSYLKGALVRSVILGVLLAANALAFLLSFSEKLMSAPEAQ